MAINQLLPAKKNIAVPGMKYSFLFLGKFNKLLSFKNKRLRIDYMSKKAYKDDIQKRSAVSKKCQALLFLLLLDVMDRSVSPNFMK